jgi:hypothetical protein
MLPKFPRLNTRKPLPDKKTGKSLRPKKPAANRPVAGATPVHEPIIRPSGSAVNTCTSRENRVFDDPPGLSSKSRMRRGRVWKIQNGVAAAWNSMFA